MAFLFNLGIKSVFPSTKKPGFLSALEQRPVYAFSSANGQENTDLNNILYVCWHNTKHTILKTLLLCLKLTSNI